MRPIITLRTGIHLVRASRAEDADVGGNPGLAKAESIETEVEESVADEASTAEAPQDDGADADPSC